MAETKHGGSPALGLVPAGLENLPKLEGSTLLLEAPSVGAGRKDATANAERARQFERRRIALVVLPSLLTEGDSTAVASALEIADDLLRLTGGHV